MYVVCKNHDYRQTYSVENFNKDSRNIKCEKCNGELIGKEGSVQLSANSYVIKTI